MVAAEDVMDEVLVLARRIEEYWSDDDVWIERRPTADQPDETAPDRLHRSRLNARQAMPLQRVRGCAGRVAGQGGTNTVLPALPCGVESFPEPAQFAGTTARWPSTRLRHLGRWSVIAVCRRTAGRVSPRSKSAQITIVRPFSGLAQFSTRCRLRARGPQDSLRRRTVIRRGAQESKAVFRKVTRVVAFRVDMHKSVSAGNRRSDDHLDDMELDDSRREYFELLEARITAQAAEAVLLRERCSPLAVRPDAGTYPHPSSTKPATISPHPMSSQS
jgi:hypothetical protein